MLALGTTGLVGVQLGHFLHIDAYALTVKKHKVHSFDGGGHSGHKVAGDGLQDELGRRLLREPVPVGENTVVSTRGVYSEPTSGLPCRVLRLGRRCSHRREESPRRVSCIGELPCTVGTWE